MRITLISFLYFFYLLPSAGAIPVFPTAKGYGTDTVAGSGRNLRKPQSTIVRVINLSDDGPGSLRACAESVKGPRTCVFETSGVINLRKPLKIDKPYLTIAGQTAPEPGLMLRGAGIRVATHDVLIQHLRIRVGDAMSGPDPRTRDGISIGADSKSSYNVVIDHCSVSWAIDENLSTWYADTRDITISNTLVAEGLDNSIHPKGPHSKGVMFGDGSQRISFHHNLVANHVERNPYLKPGTSVEVVNNVVYGWGSKGGWMLANLSDSSRIGDPVRLNFVGNYYKPGPHSVHEEALFAKPAVETSRIFAKANIGPTRMQDVGNEWLISNLPEKPFRLSTPAVRPTGIVERKPEDSYQFVLNNAGAYPAFRDKVDARVVQEVREGKGGIKDCVVGCAKSAGGWPSLARHYRSLTVPSDPLHVTDSGYTRLELWLQEFSKSVEARD
ncbi:MAG: hypothetical protein KDD62_06765 [Bdellovibrionales bacterium]|nr:hypothetical protein [Bdellovibrionales bacterium]